MKKILPILFAVFAVHVNANEPKVISPQDRTATPFPGQKIYILSDHESTPSKAAFLEILLPAKAFGAPPHIHLREDEHFYVLEGQVEFLDRENVVSAGPGSLIVLPRGHLHGFWNKSDTDAKLILVVTPGEFASFFDQVVATIRTENADTPEAVSSIIAKVADQYQVTIHPEKVPESALELLPR